MSNTFTNIPVAAGHAPERSREPSPRKSLSPQPFSDKSEGSYASAIHFTPTCTKYEGRVLFALYVLDIYL